MRLLDTLLLHLAHDPLFAITIPSKTQSYLAMGRPIMAGVAGEAAEFLREFGAALTAPPEDAEALAQAICALADLPHDRPEAMARAGQNFHRRELSFDEGPRLTLTLIEGLNCKRGKAHQSHGGRDKVNGWVGPGFG